MLGVFKIEAFDPVVSSLLLLMHMLPKLYAPVTPRYAPEMPNSTTRNRRNSMIQYLPRSSPILLFGKELKASRSPERPFG
jgi:hypothetical protein